MPGKLKAVDAIWKVLSYQDGETWLAIHEIANQAKALGFFISENSIGSRLPEMALKGMVESRVRYGTPYKEWKIKNPQMEIVGEMTNAILDCIQGGK